MGSGVCGQMAGSQMKVCLISEGSYPIVRGGLSEWAHLLMKTLRDVEFDVLCIAPKAGDKPLYEKLPNVNRVIIRPILRKEGLGGYDTLPRPASVRLGDTLASVLRGRPVDCERLARIADRFDINKGWLRSRGFWDSLTKFYEYDCPDVPFVEFYWSAIGTYSIVLDTIDLMRHVPRADCYHSLNSGLGGFIGALAKMMHDSSLVVTEQGLYLKERRNELDRLDIPECQKHQIMSFSESMTKTTYRYADWIVPPCRSHTDIEVKLGCDLAKIRVVNNGIECDRFRPGSRRNGGPPVIGCFARVVPIKGIDVLVRAASTVLASHQADFVVVGEIQDKEYFRECEALVEQFDLRDRFKFIGHADSSEWYHRVDIFVLSSLSEGVPYALLEAMSSGLPSVCTAVGGVPEIVSDGVGYLVPPNDSGSLAERICELLGNDTLRKSMGQRATEIANRKYTIQDMASEFRKLYEEGPSQWDQRAPARREN
jgi:glycosyltransferase involved in cell wall biosynthesis